MVLGVCCLGKVCSVFWNKSHYLYLRVNINHKSIKMNVLIKGRCTSSYDAVYEDFLEGSETRAECCDESKTTIK